MNKEALLMDYLYGEMNADQRREFEQVLRNDPALTRELDELREARSVLAAVEEEEPQPTVISFEPYVSPWRKWLWPMGIAASFLLLLGLTNARFEATNNQVILAFGKKETAVAPQPAEPVVGSLPPREVSFEQKLLAADSLWQVRMLQQEKRIKQEWQRQLKNSMTRFANQIRDEQYPEIINLVQDLQIQQQQDMQILLTNFWQEYQKTRLSDLESIGTEFTNVYHNVENNKNETEAMFVNLLSGNGDF